MSESVELLKAAISNVPKHYFELQNPKNYSQVSVYPERLFCYELYHQLRCELERRDKKINAFIDAEIYKRIEGAYVSKLIDEQERRIYIESKQKIDLSEESYPDLVIHTDQKIKDKQYQYLILECKTKKVYPAGFNKDYLKLNEDTLLNFQECVYLILNNKESDVRDLLKKYKEEYWVSSLNKVRILVKEDFSKEIVEI